MSRHRVDEVAGWDAQIQVDIRGLREFAEAVREHVDSALRAEVRRAYMVYEQGVGFGGALAHSGDIQAARQQYHDCLTSMSEVLADHLGTAETMVLAVEEVARRYGGADAMAAASGGDIESAWTGAYDAAQADAARVAAAAQHERRLA